MKYKIDWKAILIMSCVIFTMTSVVFAITMSIINAVNDEPVVEEVEIITIEIRDLTNDVVYEVYKIKDCDSCYDFNDEYSMIVYEQGPITIYKIYYHSEYFIVMFREVVLDE